MEQSMMRPDVKKKPKQPVPPPKPTQMNGSNPVRQQRPTPVVPSRPKDAELINTQYRMRMKAQASSEQQELNTSTKQQSLHKKTGNTQDPGEASAFTRDQTDFRKAENQSIMSGMFQRSQKEKTPSFTSYVSAMNNNKAERDNEEAPSEQATGRNKGGLTGAVKALTPSPKAVTEAGPDGSTEAGGSAKEQCTENTKQGNFFTGILKKSNKPSNETLEQENISAQKNLSASNDSLSESSKEKGGIGAFTGMFKKTPKAAKAAQNDESELSASNENLSDNNNTKRERGGVLSGMFKKASKQPEGEQAELQDSKQSTSMESLPENKEKEWLFSGLLKKTAKAKEKMASQENLAAQEELSASNESLSKDKDESRHQNLSASNESLSEKKEKGGMFSGLLKKTPKPSAERKTALDKDADLSASNEDLCESTTTKEKNVFTNIFKKPQKPADGAAAEKDKESLHSDLSTSSDSLTENKEKGGALSEFFRKASRHASKQPTEEDELLDKELSASREKLAEDKKEKGAGLFSGFLKITPKASGEKMEDRDTEDELSASKDDLSEKSDAKDKKVFGGMFKKPQKPAESTIGNRENDREMSDDKQTSDNLAEVPKQKKGGLAGIFKRSNSLENLLNSEEKGGLFSGQLKKPPKASEDNAESKDTERELSASSDSLNENAKEKGVFSGMFKKANKPGGGVAGDEGSANIDKKLSASADNLSVERTGGFSGLFKRSPKPAPRSADPLTTKDFPIGRCDSLPDLSTEEGSPASELLASNDSLNEVTSTAKEKKGGFSAMMKWKSKAADEQESADTKPLQGSRLKRTKTITRKTRVVSFRVKKTLPRMFNTTSQNNKLEDIAETMELQELTPAEVGKSVSDKGNTVVIQPVEMAPFPTEGNPLESEEEDDGLLEWWKTVEGWTEWNETSNFQEEDSVTAVEEAADRVFMAARLFVHLFNQQGATLQQHILELLALADAADLFHKKTVQAAVGGGVASVAGSVATITGLILAPFTFGASIIVTAVGIGVATAGSITSATANITDTVHSNMDRKKVEKMIQQYQDDIKDIRECLEFVQEGMDTLQEWDFEKYSESAAKKALNHNIKHVMKEGGRAGKALMINTDKLISTVQVLGAAGGAAKAAQAISVTTGVMSALFLALDVFFLAKDSHELRKGAKTKFASKIRQVCKDLQDGLLELNKVKCQLQKTIDGIELEEYEEIEEVEEEVEDDLESDPAKLAELEQELDLLEEKLDKKAEEGPQKNKLVETDHLDSKRKGIEKEGNKENSPEEETADKPEEQEGTKDAKKEEKKENKQTGNEGIDKAKQEKNKNSKEDTTTQVSNATWEKAVKREKDTEDLRAAEEDKKEIMKEKATEILKAKQKLEENERGGKSDKAQEKGRCSWGEVKREEGVSSEHARSDKDEKSKSNRERVRAMAETHKETPERKDRRDKEEQRSPRGHSVRSEGDRKSERKEVETGERGWRERRAEMTWDHEKDIKERRESKTTKAAQWEKDTGGRHVRKESSNARPARSQHSQREWRSSREEEAPQEDTRRHHSGRERRKEGGEDSRVASMRKQFERDGGETEKRREEAHSRRSERDKRRGDGDRERESTKHRGSSVLLDDGLYI